MAPYIDVADCSDTAVQEDEVEKFTDVVSNALKTGRMPKVRIINTYALNTCLYLYSITLELMQKLTTKKQLLFISSILQKLHLLRQPY